MVSLVKMKPGWREVRFPGGGFVAGGDIHSDGTMVARCDTDAGAYLWNAARQRWKRMTTVESMPAADIGPQYASQVNAIRIDPTNSSIFWMTTRGYLYKSINKGRTWLRTDASLPRDISGSNVFNYQEGRLQNDRITVSPTDGNHVVYGSYHNGVYVTFDGGDTWTQGTGIPVSAVFSSSMREGHGIAFIDDDHIMASSRGNGYYLSSDGGLTWTLSTATLSTNKCFRRTSTGVLFALENISGSGGERVFRYDGSWTQMAITAVTGWRGLAINPTDDDHIVVIGGAKAIQTFDGGDTWQTAWNNNSPAATTYTSNNDWMVTGGALVSQSVGEAKFYPDGSKIVVFEGIGVWELTVPAVRVAPNHLEYNSITDGIENLVSFDITSPPGGPAVYISSDRPAWTIENVNVSRSYYYPMTFQHGFSIDYASSDPKFLCCVANTNGEDSGYSKDGGLTWTEFSGKPASVLGGGMIAASTPLNMCWVHCNESAGIYYTLDGGANWTLVPNATFGLTPSGSTTGWGFASYCFRHILCADRVLPNTFYAYNYLDTATRGGGVFKSTDGGATWSDSLCDDNAVDQQIGTGVNANMRALPFYAGHLLWSAGGSGSVAEFTSHPQTSCRLSLSKDGGATWAFLPGIREPNNFGFGAAMPGGDLVTVYCNGWYDDGGGYDYGNWMCTNITAATPTWSLVGGTGYPMGHYSHVKAISGDMNVPGMCYVGHAGSSLSVYVP